MDPIHTRLTAIENFVEDNDDVSRYDYSKINRQSNRYGVCISATEVPRKFLELMEDRHTDISYIKADRPIAIRVRVEPSAKWEWDYDHLLRHD